MDSRLIAAVTSSLEGLNVRELCRDHGIAPKTFYKWRKRYLEEGLAGLYERSRRPLFSPQQFPEEVVSRVLVIRQDLLDRHRDAGPLSINSELAIQGDEVVPSPATIWRMLVEKELITPQPKKKPKSSYVRFEADSPNEMWQIDFTEWLIGDKKVYVFNIIDDHSRLAVASVVVPSPTTRAAWEIFSNGVVKWGLPWRCLSDNGIAFSGKIRNFEVFFEKQLRAAGIQPVTSRPYHPQTCGKVERFQQSLKRWLKAQPKVHSIDQLQVLLDEFCQVYNHERPHQGIGRTTPHARWSASPRVGLASDEGPSGQRRHTSICYKGNVTAGKTWKIGIGAEYSGKTAEIVIDGLHALVFINDLLVRSLQLDPTRRYQPTGLSPGRRTKAS